MSTATRAAVTPSSSLSTPSSPHGPSIYYDFISYSHYIVLFIVFFFFFQAEDGIRDLTVTGVQTCALPISGRRLSLQAEPHALSFLHQTFACTVQTAFCMFQRSPSRNPVSPLWPARDRKSVV